MVRALLLLAAILLTPFTPVLADDVTVQGTVGAVATPGGPGGGGSPPAPILTGPVVSGITMTSAQVGWTTSIAMDSTLAYGITPALELGSLHNPLPETGHAFALTGLTPGVTYYVQVSGVALSGESLLSGVVSFTTLLAPDDVPPANPTMFTVMPVLGQPSLQLTWVNPPDADFAGVRLVRRDDRYPVDVLDGVLVYTGVAEAFLDTPLTFGQTYYYALFAYDAAGNLSSGALGQGTVWQDAQYLVRSAAEKRVARVGQAGVQSTLAVRGLGSATVLRSVPLVSDVLGEARTPVTEVAGTYDFALKGRAHLRRVLTGVPVAATGETLVDFTRGGTQQLLAGDVHASQDNFVNSLDISTLLARLATGDVVGDFNGDGLVNSLEINILLANLGKFGE